MKSLKRAFTLVEVNLAIFIMAGGVLAMVSLYSLGFRESQQSRDDVAAAGYADAFFAPLVAGLSSTTNSWNKWKGIDGNGSSKTPEVCESVLPRDGWAAYVKTAGNQKTQDFIVEKSCNTIADGVFGSLMNAVDSTHKGAPSQKPPYYALVATRRGGTISLGFRSSRRLDQLMSQPIYYTEVRFQGDPNP